MMKSRSLAAMRLGVLVLLLANVGWAQTVGSAFTYQGQLTEGGSPVEGRYDFRFQLYDESGVAVGDPVERSGFPVTQGLFAVSLDFGREVWDGHARLLQVEVRPTGPTGHYTALVPRQPVMPAPYASTAGQTVGIDGHSLDAADGTPVDALYVDSGGQVGIGTLNPVHALDVYGTVKAISLRLGETATAGHVLTADGSGFGTWQPPSGGGSCLWTSDVDGHIYYNDGHVGLSLGLGEVPMYPLQVGGTAMMNGFRLGASASPGHVLTADASGFGTWQAPAAGDSLWELGDEDNIYYGDGFVGIGFGSGQAPAYPLHVNGTAMMGGFKLGQTAVAGHVLTADAQGYGTWQQADGTPWSACSNGISYDQRVGIGTTAPASPLHVTSDSYTTAKFVNTSISSTVNAVRAESDSVSANVVAAFANATNGDAAAIYGRSYSQNAKGVFGVNTVGGYAVYGEADDAGDGWAGYFDGYSHFTNRVGVGRLYPQEMLDVNGTVKMTGFRLGATATAGQVLTCNGSGMGTWQAISTSGFDLPIDETVDADGNAALRIENTGSGVGTYAFKAEITNSSSQDSGAGYFHAENGGYGIVASSQSCAAVRATSGGIGVTGSGSGEGGGKFTGSANGGYGVKGVASSDGSSYNNRGGWFVANGDHGRGVHATTSGDYGQAIRVEATGGEGIGIFASSVWTGIDVWCPRYAGRFHGSVAVYEFDSGDRLFHVDENTGDTTVRVLQIEGGADLSEPFDVADEKMGTEPGMVVSIDPDEVGQLMVSREAYDRKVAGVISGAGGISPGVVMGQAGTVAHGAHPIALTGRVWTLCDATGAAIVPGDLLTTSDVAGHAMKAADARRAPGAVIGKAMSRLAKGERGLVLVLVNLQ